MMHFELVTPWGTFTIGYFDGTLLWIALLTIAAALGGVANHGK